MLSLLVANMSKIFQPKFQWRHSVVLLYTLNWAQYVFFQGKLPFYVILGKRISSSQSQRICFCCVYFLFWCKEVWERKSLVGWRNPETDLCVSNYFVSDKSQMCGKRVVKKVTILLHPNWAETKGMIVLLKLLLRILTTL